MKFYNPFKPHIISYCDGISTKYYVRRWRLFWEYLDDGYNYRQKRYTHEIEWWNIKATRCTYDSLERAKQALDWFNNLPKEKTTVILE